MELQPLITDAGLQAAFNASSTGFAAEITHIGLGTGSYVPTANQTGLTNEKLRVPIADGKMLDVKQLHVTAIANDAQNFWVKEVGFFLADGTLLAVWSDTGISLAYKSANVGLLLAFDLALAALPANAITIVSTGASLNLNFATELAQLATASISNMTRHIQLEQRLRNGGL